MVLVEYTEKLQNLTIPHDAFEKIEKIVFEELRGISVVQEIAIEFNNWKRYYNSTKELFADPNKPDEYVLSYWSILSEDETTQVKIQRALDGYTLTVIGEENFVKNCVNELVSFLEKFVKEVKIHTKKVNFEKIFEPVSLEVVDILELERILVGNSSVIEKKIIIKHNGVKNNYNSILEFIEKSGVVNIDEFDIKINCREGELWVYQLSKNSISVHLSGDKEWVLKKKEEILLFFERRIVRAESKEISFKSDAPPIYLPCNSLKDLEKIMTENCDNYVQEIEITSKGVTKSYNSIGELLDDPSKPRELFELTWRVNCEKGRIWLQYTGNSGYISLSGLEEWATYKRNKLVDFLSKHKRKIGYLFKYDLFDIILFPLLIFSFIFSISYVIKENLVLSCGFAFIFVITLLYFTRLKPFVGYAKIEFQENKLLRRLEEIIVALFVSIIGGIILYVIYKIF